MLQNYRFSGTFKTVTLTTNYIINNLELIHNLSTYYQQVIHKLKTLIKSIINNIFNNKMTNLSTIYTTY